MKKGFFICFIGIDGSGKTTLINRLIEDFEKDGVKLKYKWSKFESKFLKLIILFKDKIFMEQDNLNDNYKKSSLIKNKMFGNYTIYWIYEHFVLYNYIFQILIKVDIAQRMGKNVICDRYVYDTIVDLSLDLMYTDEKINYRLEQLFNILPFPDIIFTIDIPEEVAFKRKDDIPSLEFLKNKKAKYLIISEFLQSNNYNYFILNGLKSIEELKKESEEIIKRYLTNE